MNWNSWEYKISNIKIITYIQKTVKETEKNFWQLLVDRGKNWFLSDILKKYYKAIYNKDDKANKLISDCRSCFPKFLPSRGKRQDNGGSHSYGLKRKLKIF